MQFGGGKMKVIHWTIQNNSGMNNVAASMVDAEKKLGVDSILCNPEIVETWDLAENSDIQVVHTHFPDSMRKRIPNPKIVYVGHGTPEHVFQSAVESGLKGGYAAPDGWMLLQYWLQHADAIVTFWERHQRIYQSLCDKGRKINLVPLGIEKSFWKPTESRGKFLGAPSVFSSENPHYMKWPLDLLLAWGWVKEKLPEAHLHLTYMVRDQHKWFYPLANRNGSSYGAFVSELLFHGEDLRNAFCSTDFYVGLVRYGDFNRICLEANASGAKTISYYGNPYSDFWIPEGDQRVIADYLIKILDGEVAPRKKTSVPDISETANEMIKIYETL
jgi:uncharacterized protein